MASNRRSPRFLELQSKPREFKLLRTISGFNGSAILQGSIEKQTCTGVIGQHYYSGIHKWHGRFDTKAGRYLSCASRGGNQRRYSPDSEIHIGQKQLESGFSVTDKINVRVETASQPVQDVRLHVGATPHRQICFYNVHTVGTIQLNVLGIL